MRAIRQTGFGEPREVLRLQDVPAPTPGKGRVLVRVAAAGVDQGVLHLVEGVPTAIRLALRPSRERPIGVGLDVAGVVEAVGPGVEGFVPGDEVLGEASGTWADLAVARASKLVPKPAGLGFEEAAVVGVSGVTALQACDTGGVTEGRTVLVTGAAGGVGSWAVQLAAARGATVTGVCRGSAAEFVRGLGADDVVAYDDEASAGLGGRTWDVIVDCGGGRRLGELRGILASRGTLVLVGAPTERRELLGMGRGIGATLLSPFVPQRMRLLLAISTAADLARLTELIASGAVRPRVDRTFALADAPAALDALRAGGVHGKLAITVARPDDD